ncbi:MAG: hypothetical protein ACQERN_03510 [Thermodesulfobacteriota bacterium]
MIKYIMSLKRSGRSCMDPLPMDFGSMYFLYPAGGGYVKSAGNAGLREKLVNKSVTWWKRLRVKDETRDFRPEKIY